MVGLLAGATKPGLILGRGICAMHLCTARGVGGSTLREGQRSAASLAWVCSVIPVDTHVLLPFWLKLTQYLNYDFCPFLFVVHVSLEALLMTTVFPSVRP